MVGIVERAPQHQFGPPTPTSTSTTTTATTQSSTTPTTTSTTSSVAAATTSSTVSTTESSSHTSITSAQSSGLVSSSNTAAGANAATTASSPTSTSVPQLSEQYVNNSNGLSSGAIAAAVIVPLIAIAFVFAVLFMLRRRRRNTRNTRGLLHVPAMRQRAGNDVEGPSQAFIAPGMMGTNTAYYTGLDTGSEREHSGEYYAPGRSDTSSFAEPPPPYKAKTHNPSSLPQISVGPVPLVRLPTGMPQDPPSPDSWATAPHDAAFLDSSSAFTRSVSRAGTERSINSDSYSDNASVHSAHAARMSMAGANVISNASQSELDPFEDPASPVSSVDGDERRSFNESVPSRGISPVSSASRARSQN